MFPGHEMSLFGPPFCYIYWEKICNKIVSRNEWSLTKHPINFRNKPFTFLSGPSKSDNNKKFPLFNYSTWWGVYDGSNGWVLSHI